MPEKLKVWQVSHAECVRVENPVFVAHFASLGVLEEMYQVSGRRSTFRSKEDFGETEGNIVINQETENPVIFQNIT